MILYLWKESHAYNKGKALVVSKVPLPMYRADLDERHGSTQKEVKTNASYVSLSSLAVECIRIYISFDLFADSDVYRN